MSRNASITLLLAVVLSVVLVAQVALADDNNWKYERVIPVGSEIDSIPYFVIESTITPGEVNTNVLCRGLVEFTYNPDWNPFQVSYRDGQTLTRYGWRMSERTTCSVPKVLRLFQYLLGTPAEDVRVTISKDDEPWTFDVEMEPGEVAKAQAAKSDLLSANYSELITKSETDVGIGIKCLLLVRHDKTFQTLFIKEWAVCVTELEEGHYLYTIVPSKIISCEKLQIEVSLINRDKAIQRERAH